MSSEELILDLEVFINKGLAKGLRGWPAKGPEGNVSGDRGNQRGRWHRLVSGRLDGTARPEVFEAVGAF